MVLACAPGALPVDERAVNGLRICDGHSRPGGCGHWARDGLVGLNLDVQPADRATSEQNGTRDGDPVILLLEVLPRVGDVVERCAKGRPTEEVALLG